jgi:lysyl-tRNA synthetase class II
MDVDAVRKIAAKHNIKTDSHWGSGRIIEEIFAELAEGELQEPTFVTGHPVEISPLARADRNDPYLTERFELFIGARELANGYSELNDPVKQRLLATTRLAAWTKIICAHSSMECHQQRALVSVSTALSCCWLLLVQLKT